MNFSDQLHFFGKQDEQSIDHIDKIKGSALLLARIF
jgi:hypothetical protein